MRVPTALVTLSLAATLAIPAAPAEAAVGCGGTYVLSGSCTFSTFVQNTQILISGRSYGSTLGRTSVSVAVYLQGATTPVISCTGRGLATAECSASVVLPFVAGYTCRGGGLEAGWYACTTAV